MLTRQFPQFILFILTVLFCLGDSPAYGQENPSSTQIAKWRKGAEHGDAQAQCRLAECYAQGLGVPQNNDEAFKWVFKAAEQGNAKAQYNVGWCYYDGVGVPKDTGVAIKWYRKAADQGDPLAQCNLGFCYYSGQGVPQDYVEAVRWFRKAADQGHANAQYNLGRCYSSGIGVPKAHPEAVKWLQKAAKQGNAQAQYDLGQRYAEGLGVQKNEVEAVAWYQKSANQGYPLAQYNLGASYLNGIGLKQDFTEAAKWFCKAADQGDLLAQYNLGLCYFNGLGVDKDEAKSVIWWRKATDQGFAAAQYNLGFCYYSGQGVPQDYVEAVRWFRKAADQGYADAQRNLGACYVNGSGVVKNEVEGYKWALLAAAQGDEIAKGNAANLETLRLSPAQRAEGQRLAQEWEASHANRKAAQEAERRPEAAAAAGDEPKATGTGFLITRNGYLVTNHHVVKDCGKVRVQTAAGILDAAVVRVDAASDLALLKVDGNFDAVPVVSSRSARLGATVATVGFPNIGLQGFEPKLSKGDISSLAGIQDDVRYFQISVPVQPGNSGGPLVDERGNVVGVVTLQLSQEAALESSGTLAQNVNYAVKSSYLLSFLEAVPKVSTGMLDAKTDEQKFEAVVDDVKKAAVLIIGY